MPSVMCGTVGGRTFLKIFKNQFFMIKNKLRIGNFTSSEIAALMKTGKGANGFGAPAITYIEETNIERRLGRSITDESNARPLTWGKLLEGRVFDLLGIDYTLSSTETEQHPNIDFWTGSKDGKKQNVPGGCIIEIKCPITLKSYCQLVQALYDGLTGMAAMEVIRETHKDGEKFYWQCVSNSCISNTKYAELIIYMPYYSELPAIKMLADGLPNAYWIAMAGEDELPYLLDGGYYKNLNVISFEVPQSDKDLLTANVLKAGKMLINPSAPAIDITTTVSTNNEKPVLI